MYIWAQREEGGRVTMPDKVDGQADPRGIEEDVEQRVKLI
jgi:hypothetical protein